MSGTVDGRAELVSLMENKLILRTVLALFTELFFEGVWEHNFEKIAAVRGYHTYIVQCGLSC